MIAEMTEAMKVLRYDLETKLHKLQLCQTKDWADTQITYTILNKYISLSVRKQSTIYRSSVKNKTSHFIQFVKKCQNIPTLK